MVRSWRSGVLAADIADRESLLWCAKTLCTTVMPLALETRICLLAAPLPPLTPLIPLNVLNGTGYPVRNDNVTNFAYVGNGTGKTPPEMYTAYHPGNERNPKPINANETTILKNLETGKYCRLAPMTPQGGCNTQGMLCDQSTSASATILTYTGMGLAYNGTPLVQLPGSGTLVLRTDPKCGVPGGDKLTFPPGPCVIGLAVCPVMVETVCPDHCIGYLVPRTGCSTALNATLLLAPWCLVP